MPHTKEEPGKAPVTPGIAHGHEHAEAFCLMLYRSRDGKEEWVWNSRDGVTPFSLAPKGAKKPIHMDDPRWLTHADWWRDTYAPNYKPLPGSRFFRDWTREEAEEFYRSYARENYGHLTPDETDKMVRRCMLEFEPGQPTAEEVPE